MKLKELRKAEKISQLELSKRLSVSRSTIAMWEQGTNPDPEMLKNIADVFNVSVDYLLGREEAQQKMPPVTDDLDKELIALLTGMSSDKKQRILDFAHGIDAAK